FADARKLLPRPWPASWSANAASAKDRFVVTIQSGKPLQGGTFFPFESNQIENAAQQNWEMTAQGARITLKKSEQLLKPIRSLNGLLVLAGGASYEIRAPVTNR